MLDKQGSAIFISTPDGKNWFWRLYEDVKHDKENGKVWQFPSSANPYLNKKDLARIKEKVPDLIWRQEYLAEFVEGAGQVFRGVRECVMGELEECATGPAAKDRFRYVIGWDPAKVNDYSVVTVVDKVKKQVVYFDRFRDLDWVVQKNKVKGICDAFGCGKIIMDTSGGRDSLADDLSRDGYTVEHFNYTASSKRELITNLVMKIEKWEIGFPAIPELIEELEAFSTVITPAGNVRYTAPHGMHDDCVNSLALACWGMGNIPYNPNYSRTRKRQYVKIY